MASGDRQKEVRSGELYEVSDGAITGFRGEQAITSAILEVTSDKQETIYFLFGHGEMRLEDVDPLRGLSQLETFLKERNFLLGNLDLAVAPQVPEDADLVIIPSPQASLLPEEIEKLRRYMTDRNGRILAFIDPGRRHGMEDLLFDWGILADDRTIVESGSDYRAQGGDLIIRRFAQHPITDLLVEYKINALFGASRPVRTDPASLNDPRLQVDQIIGTSESSWAERDYRTETPVTFTESRDLRGPVSIAAASTRSAGSQLGINIPGGRIVVFGNSDFIANTRLQAFGNRTLFFNALNWTLARNSLLNIPSRSIESYQVVLSEKALTRLLRYFCLLPLAAGVLGILIALIRRR